MVGIRIIKEKKTQEKGRIPKFPHGNPNLKYADIISPYLRSFKWLNLSSECGIVLFLFFETKSVHTTLA